MPCNNENILLFKVDESERARSQLEDTGGKPSQINIDEIERSLKKKDKEIKKLKSTEKAMVRSTHLSNIL